MRKWLYLVLGTVVAFWFHAEFSGQTTLLDFALAFGLAGALFLYGAPAPVAAPISSRDVPGASRRRLWVAAGCTLLALAAAAGATWLLWQRLSDPFGLALWGGAALCLLVGWWQPAQATRRPSSGLWTWWLLLGIVLLALVVRLWKLETYPYGLQSDESNNARDALQWLAGAPYAPYSEANRGQATLFTYLIALSFKLLGVNVLAMRYVAVFVGTVTVLSFYVLARTLLSPPAALLSTALLAVSRWHITFSRIIYELILTPLALIWLFYFLYRGLRERTPRYFVLAGFALAFGFNTYTAFRVAPFGVAFLLLFWLVADWRRFWGNLARLLLFTLSALIGVVPLLIYALQKPEVILWRIRELSIFDEMATVGTWQPLWYNLRSYAAMFNLIGDRATLNNLPDAPMVSWVAGTLFVLGLLYAIRYWYRFPMFLLLAWSLAVLPAGILSVTVETPSARRVIGLAPLLFLLVGVAADVLRRATATTWRKQLQWVWPLGAALVFMLFAFAELKTFAAQASDINVQRAFNISEWSVGSYMATVDPMTTQILLDRSYVDNNIVAFASQNKPYTLLDEIRDIPFLPKLQSNTAESVDRDLLYILRPSRGQLRPLLEHFYPQGYWEEHVDPQGLLLFHTFALPLSAQQGLQGLLARYYTYPAADQNGPPTLLAERVEARIGEPAPVAPPYRVEWSGSLLVQQHGVYEFQLETTAPFTLTVADQVLITRPATTTLYAGLHALHLTVDVTSTTGTGVNGGARGVALQWRGPLPHPSMIDEPPNTALLTVAPPTFGLIGAYYPNNRWEGTPAVIRHDLVVAPNETLPSPYSVIWRGQFWAPAEGLYTLGLNADDGALLYLDEQLLVDNGGLHGARYVENHVQLTAGLHEVAIHYVQDGGAQALDILGSGPNGGQGPLPVEQLLPYAVDVTRLVMTAAPATTTALTTPITTMAAEQATVIQEADGPFAQPRGIAVSGDGRVYVADTGNRRLVGLTVDGAVLFTQNAGAEPLQEPFDLGVDDAGQVYVLDPAAARIDLFTGDGVYLRQFNAAPDLVERARGLWVTPQGDVWIAHTPGGRVVQLSPTGELVRIIPIPGAQPVDVAVDSNGVIYITDVEQQRLLRLDQNGQIVAEYTIPTANGIDGPHLAIDHQNALYITEPEAAAILKLSPDGQVLFHQKLPAPSGVLVKPIGIAVDTQGRLWTTDAQGGSVWRLNPAQ